MYGDIVLKIHCGIVHERGVAIAVLPECRGGGHIVRILPCPEIALAGPLGPDLDLVVHLAEAARPVGFQGDLAVERTVVSAHCVVPVPSRYQDDSRRRVVRIVPGDIIPFLRAVQGHSACRARVVGPHRALPVVVDSRGFKFQIRDPGLAEKPPESDAAAVYIVPLAGVCVEECVRVRFGVVASEVPGQARGQAQRGLGQGPAGESVAVCERDLLPVV